MRESREQINARPTMATEAYTIVPFIDWDIMRLKFWKLWQNFVHIIFYVVQMPTKYWMECVAMHRGLALTGCTEYESAYWLRHNSAQ